VKCVSFMMKDWSEGEVVGWLDFFTVRKRAQRQRSGIYNMR
jgi:hypothetical protein